VCVLDPVAAAAVRGDGQQACAAEPDPRVRLPPDQHHDRRQHGLQPYDSR
jgi:hypothetical protein